MEYEHLFQCPHCGEQISVLLDLSQETQEYIEDCEVCCRPIRISYNALDGKLGEFAASPEG